MGYFKNGIGSKYGKKILHNGAIYIGQILSDCAHGLGMLLKKNGKVKFGKWEKGTFVKNEKPPKGNIEAARFNSIDISTDSNLKYTNYEKMFPVFNPDGTLVTATGVVEYSNHAIYLGEMKNGFRWGSGVLSNKEENTLFEGRWKDNLLEDSSYPSHKDELIVPLSWKIVEPSRIKECRDSMGINTAK